MEDEPLHRTVTRPSDVLVYFYGHKAYIQADFCAVTALGHVETKILVHPDGLSIANRGEIVTICAVAHKDRSGQIDCALTSYMLVSAMDH